MLGMTSGTLRKHQPNACEIWGVVTVVTIILRSDAIFIRDMEAFEDFK